MLKMETFLPGSPLAIKNGCTCPKLDNNQPRNIPVYWVSENCPLHGNKIERKNDK